MAGPAVVRVSARPEHDRQARTRPSCPSLSIDGGWKDVTEVALAWFEAKGF
jgi:hypothetical protein